MNGYVCNKSCTMGGVAYSVGDTVPFESVLPSRERALIKQGYISPAASELIVNPNETEVPALQARIVELETLLDEAAKPPTAVETPQVIIIPITAKGGLLELEMSHADVVLAIATIQLNADEAVKEIEKIDKEETLILIDALETRKTVKAAVADRAEKINTEGKVGKEDESQVDA